MFKKISELTEKELSSAKRLFNKQKKRKKQKRVYPINTNDVKLYSDFVSDVDWRTKLN